MKQTKQSFIIACKQLSICVLPTSRLLSTTIYYLDYLDGPVFGNLGDRSRTKIKSRSEPQGCEDCAKHNTLRRSSQQTTKW